MPAAFSAPLPSHYELLRVKQVIQIVAISRSSWLAGVKNGIFPKPLKLSPRVTVWRASDIRTLIEKGVQKPDKAAAKEQCVHDYSDMGTGLPKTTQIKHLVEEHVESEPFTTWPESRSRIITKGAGLC